MLPSWRLTRGTPTPEAAALAGPAPGRPGVWRRALGSLARALEEMLRNEALAEQPGLLQAVDARAKVLGLVGLLVVATLVHRLPTLAVAYGMCLLLAALSRVPLRRLARSWAAIPLFSGAIMLPAMLNVVTPGRPLLTLWHFASPHLGPWTVPPALTITDGGAYVAGRFVLRTAVCVALVLLLAATTRPERLLRGLRALGVPRLFVMLLSMMQRYLTVFVQAAEEIHLAKISRSVAAGTLRQEQAWVAAGMGALFRRTRALGEGVYLAMVSRGYTGEVRLLEQPRWQTTDWAFLMLAAGLGAVMVIVG